MWRWVDVSVNIYKDGNSMVKIMSYDLDSDQIGKEHKGRADKLITSRPVQSGWLKAPGKSATTPFGGNTIVGDDGASILYWADIERAISVLFAYFRKEVVMIGVRRKGEQTESIYAGAIAMTEAEDGQLRQCMSEVMAKWPK